RDRGEQRVEIRLRVGDAERNAVGRYFAADSSDRSWLLQRKRLALQRVERGFARFRGIFAIDFRTRRFGISAPVAALRDRLDRAVERRAMAFEKGVRHGNSSAFRWRSNFSMGILYELLEAV